MLIISDSDFLEFPQKKFYNINCWREIIETFEIFRPWKKTLFKSVQNLGSNEADIFVCRGRVMTKTVQQQQQQQQQQ